MEKSKALLGAGCFWGVEEVFQNISGIINTKVGYAGGRLSNPTYEDVCTGNTGHVEVVLAEFNPTIISFDQILDQFWQCHDPTQLNRQGPDVGSQYRSVIFYFNDEQKKIAEKSMIAYQKQLSSPIVTEIIIAGKFFLAEDYHQQYIQKNY